MRNDNLIQTPDISPEEFKEFITGISEELLQFFYEKNKKYRGASFQNGIMALIGNMFRQEDKLLRYKHLIFDWISNGANGDQFDQPFGESIWDTIRDQLGYAYIGLTICALYGIGPYTFQEIIDRKNGTPVHAKLPEKNTSKDELTLDEIFNEDFLERSIENLYLSNRHSPEDFSKELWTTVIRKLRELDENFLEEVKDILFLRDQLD